jgi:dienelactone hydrolase
MMIPALLMVGSVLAATSAAAGTVAVKSKAIEYKIGDQSFEGLFVYPQASKGKLPGVLMVHNWLGVSDETKRQAERMAKLGLAVFAVDVYGKGVRAKGAQDAMPLAGKYKGDRKLFRERVLRGLEILREQKEVDPAKIVAAGYCFGGTGVIELARAGADVQAVVSFHGGLDSPNPADGKNIKAKVVVLQGADDPYVKAADIAAFQSEMRSHNVDWQMTVYGGAVHSFTEVDAGSDVKTGAAYNQKADERSFEIFKDLVSDLFPTAHSPAR